MITVVRIGATIISNIKVVAGAVSNWILKTGFWNDSGEWDDSDVWID